MLKFILLGLVICGGLSISSYFKSPKDLVDFINAAHTTWKAEVNQIYEHGDPNKVLHLMGVYPPAPWQKRLRTLKSLPKGPIPSQFDPREAWPLCESIKEVRDQSNCGSCWAHSVVETITDRICIHSQQKDQTRISAEDLMTCCDDCGNGCHGGWPYSAFEYWQDEGIVSGNFYGQNK